MRPELTRETDELALRLRLTNLLGGADLRPPGVSPSALLVVRRMADPLPGRLASQWQAARTDPAWEQAVRNALTDLYRRAARPLRGQLLGAADVVLFEDEGEMLACLALDMSRGDVWGRWWWEAAMRALAISSADGLMRLLCRHARRVPAMLQHLTQWGQAVAVVNALSPAEAITVLQAVSQAFGLADLRLTAGHSIDGYGEEGGVAGGVESGPLGSAHDGRPNMDTTQALNRGGQGAPTRTAHWENWLPPGAVPRDLARERACLLGVGLALHRHTTLTQSTAFVRSLRAWWAEQEMGSANSAVSGRDRRPKDQDATPRGEAVTPEENLEKRISAQDQPIRPKSTVLGASGAQNGSSAPKSQGSEGAAVEFDSSSEAGHRDPPAAQTGESRTEIGQTVTQDTTVGGFAGGVNTYLGGVLYLINLMRHLDLPACFEEGWGLASQVGAWGTLEVLARSLMGPDGDAFAADPLWAALAALDAREPGELPGEGFRASDSYRLPPAWQVGVDKSSQVTWYWATQAQRLRLWSSRGYMLVECRGPRGEAAAEKRAREKLHTYVAGSDPFTLTKAIGGPAPIEELTGELVRGLSLDLHRWLGFVLPYVRWRLKQALKPAGAQGFELAQGVLLAQGRLYVTTTHVDLVMSLDDVSLPVRQAGLDQDPGWLVDFGRAVQFHFE